jgi:hypothetical protein
MGIHQFRVVAAAADLLARSINEINDGQLNPWKSQALRPMRRGGPTVKCEP